MRDRPDRRARRTPPTSGAPTARQQKILELGSIGLSDQEIAAHLDVSVRTIRFHLEKIFRLFGVRNRSDALALWRRSTPEPYHPGDRCPYPKPFPDDFAECPAYQASQFATLDEDARPVGRIWACRHLESRLVPSAGNPSYGACRLGDGFARRRWAERAGPERLRATNGLLHELASLTGPFALSLWKLKADQVRALEHDRDAARATRLLQARARRFIADLETFLSRRRSLLGQSEVEVDESLRLAQHLIDRILAPDSSGAWDRRFDLLLRFPWDVWSGLPSMTRDGAVPSRR